MTQKIYLVRDAEAGNVIDQFSSYEEAMEAIRAYEESDKEYGIYEEDFYEVKEVTMRTVDYFKVQVKYSGSFEEIEENEWKAKADAQAIRCDAFDHSELIDEDSAKKIDGSMWIRNIYPCNKIAEVEWAYIREEDEE